MMLRAVVGLEIDITALEGKSKLSQNREPRDIQNAAQMLRGRGKLELAGAMENPPTKSA
jgi:transcriptional regulator